MQNPIIVLSEKCQKRYGENITTEVLSQEGAGHCPTIKVAITLPSGKVYVGTGSNQKVAKQNAATAALNDAFTL